MRDKIEEDHSPSAEQEEQINFVYKFKDHIEKYVSDKTNAHTKELHQYTLNKVS